MQFKRPEISLTASDFSLTPHNQDKVIKVSLILFRLLNMFLICEHVHKLELRFIFNLVLRIYQLGEK